MTQPPGYPNPNEEPQYGQASGGGYPTPPPTPPSPYGGGAGGPYGGGTGSPYGGGPSGGGAPTPPPTYLAWGILATILCCLPLGVVSIVYAARVNNKFLAGDYAGAVADSESAKKWAIWSAVIGGIVIVIYLVLVFAGALTFSASVS